MLFTIETNKRSCYSSKQDKDGYFGFYSQQSSQGSNQSHAFSQIKRINSISTYKVLLYLLFKSKNIQSQHSHPNFDVTKFNYSTLFYINFTFKSLSITLWMLTVSDWREPAKLISKYEKWDTSVLRQTVEIELSKSRLNIRNIINNKTESKVNY